MKSRKKKFACSYDVLVAGWSDPDARAPLETGDARSSQQLAANDRSLVAPKLVGALD